MSHTQTRISTGDDGPDMIEASFYLRKVYEDIWCEDNINNHLICSLEPSPSFDQIQYAVHIAFSRNKAAAVGVCRPTVNSMQACFVLDSCKFHPNPARLF